MFTHIYFAKKMTAIETGRRLKQVICEKCGAEYFYHLHRSFTASKDAPTTWTSPALSTRQG